MSLIQRFHWREGTHHERLEVRGESVFPESGHEGVDLRLREPVVWDTPLPAEVERNLLPQPLEERSDTNTHLHGGLNQ